VAFGLHVFKVVLVSCECTSVKCVRSIVRAVKGLEVCGSG